MKRYEIRDVDNSCGDPDCCGFPYPHMAGVESAAGPLYKAEEFFEALGITCESDDNGDLFVNVSPKLDALLS